MLIAHTDTEKMEVAEIEASFRFSHALDGQTLSPHLDDVDDGVAVNPLTSTI